MRAAPSRQASLAWIEFAPHPHASFPLPSLAWPISCHQPASPLLSERFSYFAFRSSLSLLSGCPRRPRVLALPFGSDFGLRATKPREPRQVRKEATVAGHLRVPRTTRGLVPHCHSPQGCDNDPERSRGVRSWRKFHPEPAGRRAVSSVSTESCAPPR